MLRRARLILAGLVMLCGFGLLHESPVAAATCSGGWFNAQYPVGSVSAVASCQAGAVGYPYASHTSPATSVCLQYFNSLDQWVTKACTTLSNNAPPTYVVAGYISGSWRTVLTGGSGNRYSAVSSL